MKQVQLLHAVTGERIGFVKLPEYPSPGDDVHYDGGMWVVRRRRWQDGGDLVLLVTR